MSYTLGIDIGTFESKGVLVDTTGKIKTIAKQAFEFLLRILLIGWGIITFEL